MVINKKELRSRINRNESSSLGRSEIYKKTISNQPSQLTRVGGRGQEVKDPHQSQKTI